MTTNPWILGIATSITGTVIVMIIVSKRFREWVFKYLLWPIWIHSHIKKLHLRIEALERNSPATSITPSSVKKVHPDSIVLDLGLIWYAGTDMNMGPYCQSCHKDGLFTPVTMSDHEDRVYFYCTYQNKQIGTAKQLDYVIVEQRIKNLRAANLKAS